jgi:hypothetical protein
MSIFVLILNFGSLSFLEASASVYFQVLWSTTYVQRSTANKQSSFPRYLMLLFSSFSITMLLPTCRIQPYSQGPPGRPLLQKDIMLDLLRQRPAWPTYCTVCLQKALQHACLNGMLCRVVPPFSSKHCAELCCRLLLQNAEPGCGACFRGTRRQLCHCKKIIDPATSCPVRSLKERTTA